MARLLVRVELSFITEEDPEQVGDRVRESVASIVGKEHLEEFRVRSMQLDVKKKDHLRSVE
jgi:hypothetical protein